MPDRDWKRLYDHWFGGGVVHTQGWVEQRLPTWFFRDPEADRALREQFAPWLEALTPAEEAAWRQSPRGFLSLILLFDQVPRNAFRDTPRAFAWDARNLALAQDLHEAGLARELDAIEAFWTYLPFQHQEDAANQERSVRGVEACAARCAAGHQAFFFIAKDMARRHHEAITQHGRFPHRNTILTRESTPDELTFLDDPKNHF
ncbi:MAG: DUF924 domain-containing protein [Alphaproteobacteria bacterium]|nr:DUF924 domain-containing protein [Alphaproteobacteria bacterium]MCB9797272.1 DUF924 domain-containing protein [Alphaproteobacteria bacterium]